MSNIKHCYGIVSVTDISCKGKYGSVPWTCWSSDQKLCDTSIEKQTVAKYELQYKTHLPKCSPYRTRKTWLSPTWGFDWQTPWKEGRCQICTYSCISDWPPTCLSSYSLYHYSRMWWSQNSSQLLICELLGGERFYRIISNPWMWDWSWKLSHRQSMST